MNQECKMNDSLLLTLKNNAKYMRKKSLEIAYNLGPIGAHIGGGLSLIEIMAVLYGAVLKYRVEDPEWPERDRLILSKGHGTLAMYTAMTLSGFFTEEELDTYKRNETVLTAHPYMNPRKGIEFSTGSLGLGLSLGVGCALAAKRNKADYRTFVILGDGELDEGTIWEAAMSASHFNLDNLVAIIDANSLQYDGPTDSVMNLSDLARKWEAFGWQTNVIDGHKLEDIYDALQVRPHRPYVVIAKTVKGKGVSFMENNAKWHFSRLTKEQYDIAMSEQERD